MTEKAYCLLLTLFVYYWEFWFLTFSSFFTFMWMKKCEVTCSYPTTKVVIKFQLLFSVFVCESITKFNVNMDCFVMQTRVRRLATCCLS